MPQGVYIMPRVNIRIRERIKALAQKQADALGLPLSTYLHCLLQESVIREQERKDPRQLSLLDQLKEDEGRAD